ncbi:flagellar biosynthetic protein FliO [Anaeromyxobacter oryzisoli]|uniref:flagellar biosynthetic protein FliO n=1 Tax=Anaeromyxobacter oryzisoli TaxID=2925408 RepID=UPI001F57C4A1|nr:flagellar biosynthetic protein FliO [Anaeromyxobacter sp. SG63]
MTPGCARLLRLRSGRAALLLGVGVVAAGIAAPAPVALTAARAAIALAALGAAAALVRRRPAPSVVPDLAVLARAPLGKETGIALVETGGRRLLVGFGPGGVAVLDPAAGRGREEDRP